MSLSTLESQLHSAGQDHLLQYKDSLSSSELSNLTGQLQTLPNFQTLNDLFSTATEKHFGHSIVSQQTENKTARDSAAQTQPDSGADKDNKNNLNETPRYTFSPPPPSSIQSPPNKERAEELSKLGKSLIKQGKVAAICLGGGMGTRLGLDAPKGLYSPPGLRSGKSLYQLFSERIIRLKQISDNAKVLPFCIMTSNQNHEVTVDFFKKNNYFGLPEKQVIFFKQGELPAFDYTGKILLESKDKISTSPDGNGGIYPSLERSGTLKLLKNTFKVEYLHVFGVDNILVRPCDPIFLGYCIGEKKCEVGNKSCWKSEAGEKVGVIACRKTVNEANGTVTANDDSISANGHSSSHANGNGKKKNKKNGKTPTNSAKDDANDKDPGSYCVIEYSEMSNEQRELKDAKTGKLAYGAGNICNHIMSIKFLEEKVLPTFKDQYHVAEKKISCVGKDGKVITPSTPNGIKLESFIFDVFPLANPNSFAILECKREFEFAPIKNAGKGVDSPYSAVKLLADMHKQWIKNAGGKFEPDDSYIKRDPTTGILEIFEISPLISYGGEGLEEYCKGKIFRMPGEIEIEESLSGKGGSNSMDMCGIMGGRCAEKEKVSTDKSSNDNVVTKFWKKVGGLCS